MRKTPLVIISAAAGAALAYLFDPDRGRSRRTQLSQQAKAQMRDAAETVRSQAEYQAGVAKGAFHEAAATMTPERHFDDETLLQKVKSEALGQLPFQESVDVEVSNGTVAVSGSVPDDEQKQQLMQMIREVEGVEAIEDRLQTNASIS